MTGNRLFRRAPRLAVRLSAAASALALVALSAGGAAAQVATDGTMGAATTLSGPNYAITPGLGTQRGANLFHSFSTFSVPTGGSATFSGPSSVSRVVSRVTGGAVSSIDGKIASTISGADVYLINPAGVVFGANASLDVSGSFHASSASSVRFPDGGVFDAATPANTVLSVDAPSSFGFASNPAAVTVNGASLSVANGKTISLSGGDVTVNGGGLTANTGRVNLTAAAGGATMTIADGAVTAKGGTVKVTNEARVSARGSGGGNIAIRGGALVVDGAARVRADNTGSRDAIGGVTVDATTVTVSDKGQISANTESSGKAGTVDITADTFKVLGDGVTVQTLVMARSTAASTGDAGTVRVRANSVELRFGGDITASSLGMGDAGLVEIFGGDILLSHDNAGVGAGTGIFALASSSAGGNAGVVNISGRSLTVLGGAQVSTRTGSSGQAGAITVNVDDLTLSGHLGQDSSQIASQNTAGASGDAGSIVITAKNVVVSDGAHITSKSRGAGKGGSISITADSILLSTGYPDVDSGISGGSTDSATGDGGEISITAGQLTIASGAAISTATSSRGNAGTVNLNVGSLSIDGTGAPDGAVTGIVSSASDEATGSGGSITVNAGSIDIANGGSIAATSLGGGSAGNISLTAVDRIALRNASISTSTLNSDGGNIYLSAGLLVYALHGQVTTSVAGGAGDGGNITISRPQLAVSNDSILLANAFGGNGGNITISAGNVINTPGTRADASSRLGVSGMISIEAPDSELASSLTPLASDFVDPSRLLRAACADRGGDSAASSLTGAGRGGFAAMPDGPLLPTPDVTATAAAPASYMTACRQ